jgi:hypothetical protein
MYDAFTTTPDLATFATVPNPTPLAYNAAGAPLGDYAAHQNWDVPDQVQRLGEMLWAIMKPGVPWPAQYSVDSYAAAAGDEEDAAEARASYLKSIRLAQQYALTHGLWDGKRLPTINETAGQPAR